MTKTSPYEGRPQNEWGAVAAQLLDQYPFSASDVLAAAKQVFAFYFPNGKEVKQLADLEFALDHGMKPSNLPHLYKGMELGVPHFLARKLAQALGKLQPEAWQVVDMEWGCRLVCKRDNLFTLNILFSGIDDRLECHCSHSDQCGLSGYFLALHSSFSEPLDYAMRWGWIDAQDWGQIGGRFVVPAPVAQAKSVWLKTFHVA